ncbi:hypothetical protein F4823DRAFT_216563 [Ustulina deusta]|nr:hypothetical protein F4823DRAFT_216563 [Ustulina deusta]
MAKSLMKLLAISALLTGAVQSIDFLNDIPVGAYYQEGAEFVLEWTPEVKTDTFKLQVASSLVNPILAQPSTGYAGPLYDYREISAVLDDAVKLTAGNFTWVIELIDGRSGDDYYYRFGASYENTSAYLYSFHVSAA